ncbi:MAG: PKD domain-containing protein [Thermoplasmata archaeon]|nr:MAG: PKD domain-containing protein [Thermoplasmata archaeon]
MPKETVEVVAEKTPPSSSEDGGLDKRIIIVGIVVAIVIIAAVAFVFTRGDGDGDNGDNGNGNLPPTADFTYSPAEPMVNQTVTFDGASSVDPDDDTLQYSWHFGDDYATSSNPNTDSGITATHIYTMPGNYTVKLTVDDGKETDDKTYNITVVEEDIPTVAVQISRTEEPFTSATNIIWTITIQDTDGTDDQLDLANILFRVYNGTNTEDAKVETIVSTMPATNKNILDPYNEAGIYFDEAEPSDSTISYLDTFSIAGDGGEDIQAGDSIQLIYDPNGGEMMDPLPLPT